ncbi:putative calcium-transporting ATPase 13 plasma membrane-type [Bienertia sinuspersici]
MLHANLVCIEVLLRIPENLSIPNKRWQRAFSSIYCLRAFHSFVPFKSKNNEGVKLLHSSSYTILNLESEKPFSNVDQKSLANLTKQKNLQTLQESGGINSIASTFHTNLTNGIHGDEDDIANRHKFFGANTYKKPPSEGLFHFVWEAFKDLSIVILLLCAALSLGFGIKQKGPKEGWYDGGSIFVAVFLVIIVSSLSNFKQSKQFEKLSKQSNNINVDVVRGGRRQQVSIYEIVVGDVVCLKIGDQVPADGLFIEGHSLQVDESSMTGESDHVGVDKAQNPFLVSGTKVADGYGNMLVTSVGMNTTWGELMSSVSRNTDEQTPLQARLNKLTSSIGKLGLAVAVLVLVVLLVRYFTGNTTDESGKTEFNGGRTSVNDVLNAIIRIVAAAVTIVVVAIPEGLPLAVTLTLAYSMKRMMVDQAMVRKLSACETMGSATTICTDKTGTLTLNQMKVTKFWLGQNLVDQGGISEIDSELVAHIQQGVGLNTTGSVYRKRDNNEVHVHWKGAAEMILERCYYYYDASGNLMHMDSEAMETFERIIQSMAASSLRCIAFAHKKIDLQDNDEVIAQEKLTDDSLTLLGIAGVNIKMVTGDNIFTAQAIAVECGILQPGDDISSAVVEGPEFRSYTDQERIEKVDKIRIMARSSPFDKLLMVQCLKQKGHVVAVTGDGTNDAPALKEADIGLSMGLQGTEVAKESSDIVILDDNFASVATVLAINFVAAVSAGEVPLTAVQLLWVNLIMDTLGALALATEKPAKELMDKAPVGRTEPLITNIMWRNLMAQALYQIAVLLTLQFKGESIFGVGSKVKDTLLFNTFVLCQVFNEFNARKLEKKNIFQGIHKNKLFMAIIIITIILQVVMVEFLKKFANTERLNWGQWGACIGIAAVSWPIGWLVKFIPVAEKPFFSHIKWKKN